MNTRATIQEATRQLSRDAGFTADCATLYGVTEDGIVTIGEHPDVYALLDEAEADMTIVGIVLHTCGWAAPLNSHGTSDTAPSQHPERRRVSLCASVSADGAFSVLRFQDEPDELVEDEGNATGMLAEAMTDCFARLS